MRFYVRSGSEEIGEKGDYRVVLRDEERELMLDEIPDVSVMDEIVNFLGVESPSKILADVLDAENFNEILERLSKAAGNVEVSFTEDEYGFEIKGGKIYIPMMSATSGYLGSLVIDENAGVDFLVRILAILDALTSISEGYILSKRSMEMLQSSLEVLADALEKRVKGGAEAKRIEGEIFSKHGKDLYEDPEILKLSLLVYDVGKIGVRDSILGKLEWEMTREELEEYRKHPQYGYEILKNIKDLPKDILDAVLYHHERLDGSGYPFGMSGDSIPEIALVVGALDEYSARVASGESEEEVLKAMEGKFPEKVLKILGSG